MGEEEEEKKKRRELRKERRRKRLKDGVIDLLSEDDDIYDDEVMEGRKTGTQGSRSNSSNFMYKSTQVKITTISKSKSSRSKQSTQNKRPEMTISPPVEIIPKPPPRPPPEESLPKTKNISPELVYIEPEVESEHHDFCIGWLLLTLSESDDKGLTGNEPYTTTLDDVHRSLLQDYRALFPMKQLTISLETLEEAWNSGGLEEQSQKKILVLCQPKSQKGSSQAKKVDKKKVRKLNMLTGMKKKRKKKKKKYYSIKLDSRHDLYTP